MHTGMVPGALDVLNEHEPSQGELPWPESSQHERVLPHCLEGNEFPNPWGDTALSRSSELFKLLTPGMKLGCENRGSGFNACQLLTLGGTLSQAFCLLWASVCTSAESGAWVG